MKPTVSISFGLLAIALTAGCGDGSDTQPATRPATRSQPPPARLSPTEDRIVLAAQQMVRGHCRQVARYLRGSGPAPGPADVSRVGDSIERAAAVGKSNPGGVTSQEQTARETLGLIAEDLEGTNCSSAVLDRVQRALAELPPD